MTCREIKGIRVITLQEHAGGCWSGGGVKPSDGDAEQANDHL